MRSNCDSVVEHCTVLINEGQTRDQIIQYFADQDFFIIDAIKAVRILYSVSLREAKESVASHPAYEPIHRLNEPLYDAFEEAIKADENVVVYHETDEKIVVKRRL